jgi:hypothetical protein
VGLTQPVTRAGRVEVPQNPTPTRPKSQPIFEGGLLAQKLSDLAHVLVRPPPKPWTKITILGVKGSRDLIVEYNKLLAVLVR